jgi:hypothetical protein
MERPSGPNLAVGAGKRQRAAVPSGNPPIDWLCIGAQKAGTSTLYRLLRQHDELAIPPGKEVPIFDRPTAKEALEAYVAEQFGDAPEDARRGTVTPQYLYEPATAQRVVEHLPDVRVVALLRDPVARAFSHHSMSVRRGIEARSFADAVRDELATPVADRYADPGEEAGNYVTRGRYGELLTPWIELLGRERVHLELTDDLDRDPVATLRRVHAFLGVAPADVEDPSLRAHTAPPTHRLSRLRRPVAAALRRTGLLQRIPVERKEQLVDRLERVLGRTLPVAPPGVDPATERTIRQSLVDDRTVLTGLLGAEPPW